MANYKLNPGHPVEVSKEDLLTVIMELVKVKDLVKWVNTSVSYTHLTLPTRG